jgi:hypothetical protein
VFFSTKVSDQVPPLTRVPVRSSWPPKLPDGVTDVVVVHHLREPAERDPEAAQRRDPDVAELVRREEGVAGGRAVHTQGRQRARDRAAIVR